MYLAIQNLNFICNMDKNKVNLTAYLPTILKDYLDEKKIDSEYKTNQKNNYLGCGSKIKIMYRFHTM